MDDSQLITIDFEENLSDSTCWILEKHLPKSIQWSILNASICYYWNINGISNIENMDSHVGQISVIVGLNSNVSKGNITYHVKKLILEESDQLKA